MKKNGFVVLFCIGILISIIITGCASSPSENMSQLEMSLDDPRMPPDRFDSEGKLTMYWLGSQVPGVPVNVLSSFQVSKYLKDLTIDGIKINTGWMWFSYYYLVLAPGKHTFTFSYYATKSMTAYNGTDLGTVEIYFPNQKIEIDMKPGRIYSIDHLVNDISDSTRQNQAALLAFGRRTFDTSISVKDETLMFYSPPDLQKAKYRKYLEPYDPNIPVEQQAFLETRGGVYVTGFDGNSVRWGMKAMLTEDAAVTIGIPAGEHILQVASNDSSRGITQYFLPGHRYVIESTNAVKDVTGITSLSTEEIEVYKRKAETEQPRFLGHTGYINSVCFSPDGKQVLFSYGDFICLCDVTPAKIIRTFSGHTDMVNSVSFSPDGKQAISGSNDGTIKLWDIATGQEIK